MTKTGCIKHCSCNVIFMPKSSRANVQQACCCSFCVAMGATKRKRSWNDDSWTQPWSVDCGESGSTPSLGASGSKDLNELPCQAIPTLLFHLLVISPNPKPTSTDWFNNNELFHHFYTMNRSGPQIHSVLIQFLAM